METPEFFQTDAAFYNPHFTQDKRPTDGATKNGDHFTIEDLLHFPNDDVDFVEEEGGFETGILTATSTDSSAVDTSCNSSGSAAEPYFNPSHVGGHRGFDDGQFSGELCVPYDDLAELEWLSNFVEESFSSEDLQKLQLIQGMKARTNNEANSEIHQYHFQPETVSRSGPMLRPEISVPAKARSKRSRAAPGNWTSRLLAVVPTQSAATISAVSLSSSAESENVTTTSSGKKVVNKAAEAALLKKEGRDNSSNSIGEGRKCLHCATDKTPQWRTGPMGPKTLCNACGVRYKSGRLVPEYRPAASPTFVLTKHSNSHRKVVELRRQKELMRVQQHQQFLHHQNNMMFDVSKGDDYLIHQHIGPDFRQLI